MSNSNLIPQNTDVFSRFMVGMFDERSLIRVPTSFQAFFGRPETGGQTVYSPNANAVEIDIIRRDRKIAALIPRGTVSRSIGSNQKDLQEQKYSTFSRKFPLAEEEGNINADQLIYRMAGENPYERMSRLDRMRLLAASITTESMLRIIRMNEVLARQAILEGKQDAILGTTNPDLQYDFRRNSSLIVTAAKNWTNASYDILGDVDAGCQLLLEKGNVMPDMMCLGGTAMDAFIKNTTVKNLADNRRYELIEVSTANPVPDKFSKFIESGWVARGRLRTPKGYELWMFTNEWIYDDAAGTPTKIMPANKVLIASSMARCDRYFGPPETLPMLQSRIELYQELFGFNPETPSVPSNVMGPSNIVEPDMFFVDAYLSPDMKKVTVRTQAAPIFVPTMTDAFYVLANIT